jgi:hypothetical protein
MHGTTSPTALAAVTAAATPSFGPAIVTIAGLDIPIMAFGLSVMGLMLARQVAPSARRKLTKFQEWCLTGLLAMLLFGIVTGQIGGKQLGVGMGLVWGIGLGMSGLLVVEFFGEYVMTLLYAIFNRKPPEKP